MSHGPPPTNATDTGVNILVRLVGLVLILAGLPLVFGGIYLLTLGGSFYYLIAGIGLASSGLLLWRGEMMGVYAYILVFVFTLIWAFWEVGLSFWPLVPRLIAPIFLAGAVLLIVPLIRPADGRPYKTGGFVLGGLAMMAGFAAYFAGMFLPHDVIQNDVEIVPGQVSAATADSGDNWYSWGKTPEGARYAPFDQITAENVDRLEVAWTARTGFIAEGSNQLEDQNTPLFVDGTLYQCAAGTQVTALNGTTG
ncbi:hypothetical protein [Palleronia caenipelagi]|uniref:hypothetical protein n=1 Tax=Palleronia caenipelagi TaxID=2489174 RepID=UPI001C8F8ABE|nr:hypothetical protein [Palleronia caenipelagi]